jgi:hypothetical protein
MGLDLRGYRHQLELLQLLAYRAPTLLRKHARPLDSSGSACAFPRPRFGMANADSLDQQCVDLGVLGHRFLGLTAGG